MSILRKVHAVERLYVELEKDIADLHEQTRIKCVDNCISCCCTPRIVATSLEFYPLAYHLYKEGQAENLIKKIEEINNPSVCPIIRTLSVDGLCPGCIHYAYRGLICRLFSYNYYTDKYNRRRIAACKTIRVNYPQELDKVNAILSEKPIGPRASSYYSRLQIIDFNVSQQLYPIGEAIKIAVETVLTDFYYRGEKAG